MTTTQPDEDELAVKARLRALIDGPDAAAPSAQPQPRAAADDGVWWDALYADAPKASNAASTEADAQPRFRDRHRIPPWWTGRHVDLAPAGGDEENEAPRDAGVRPDTDDDPNADAGADADAEPDGDDDPNTDPQPDPDAQPKRWRPQLRIPARRTYPPDYTAGPGALIAAPTPRMSLLDAYARIPHRVRWLVLHGTAAAAGYHAGWVQYSTRTTAWIATHSWTNLSTGIWVACAIGCELLRRHMRHTILPIRWAAAVPIASIVTGTLLYGPGWNHLDLPL